MSEERVHVLACNWRLQRRPRAKLGRADETDIAGRAAKCAVTGAFTAKVDGQRPRNPSPSRTGAGSDRPKTPSSGQLGSRVGKFELGARLETMTKAARQNMRARRRWLRDLGRENVIAGTDCGPGGRVHSELAWAKLRALVEERNSLRRTSGGAKFSGLGKPESRRDFLGGRFAGGGIVGALGQLR